VQALQSPLGKRAPAWVIREAAAHIVANMAPRGAEDAAAVSIAAALVGLARPVSSSPTDLASLTAAAAAAWGARNDAEANARFRDADMSSHAVNGPDLHGRSDDPAVLRETLQAPGFAEASRKEAAAVGMAGEPTPRAVPLYAEEISMGSRSNVASPRSADWIGRSLPWPVDPMHADAEDQHSVDGEGSGASESKPGALIAVPWRSVEE